LSSAQLVHAGRHPPCVRWAGAVHALTHDNAVWACGVLRAVRGVQCRGGSHSIRPYSSPALIVKERQSFCHMANGTLQAQPLANVCKRDIPIPEIGYQTCDIKSPTINLTTATVFRPRQHSETPINLVRLDGLFLKYIFTYVFYSPTVANTVFVFDGWAKIRWLGQDSMVGPDGWAKILFYQSTVL
jgi:hypothetical protein